MTTSTQAIGVVSALQGKVFAHASNGKVRLLVLGDSVFANEVIVTASGAQVEITLFDHPALFIEELQKLALDTLIAGGTDGESTSGVSMLVSSAAETVIADRAPAVETLNDPVPRDAIRSSANTLAETEAEGNSFVDLPRIGEPLPIPEYAFPLNSPGAPPEIEGPAREAAVVEVPPPPPDDGPDARLTNPVADRLTLDESALDQDTLGGTAPAGLALVSANLADNFAAPIDFGADGAGGVAYTLDLAAATIGSGLYALSTGSTLRGAEIQLIKVGADVVGRLGTTEYFRISVDNDPASANFGKLSFSLKHSIWHDTSAGDDASSSLATSLADKLQLTQTVTDADGDRDEVSINLGTNTFSIQDSSPALATTMAVVSNEASSHGTTGVFLASADPLLIPTLDPVLGVSLTSNIATWDTGNHYGLSTLQVQDGATTRPVFLYVDAADKSVLYGYTDSNAPSNYIVNGSDPSQKLIFTLSYDASVGRYEIDLRSPLKASATTLMSSVNLSGTGTDPAADTSYANLYIAANGVISTSSAAEIVTITSPGLVGFHTASGFGLGVGGNWVGAGEKLEFNFVAGSQYAIHVTPILDTVTTGSISWTVQSATGDYFETGVIDVSNGTAALIPTTIANIEQLTLETNGTPFSISSIEGSNQADVSQLFKVAVTDNDGSTSTSQFTVYFEGSTEIDVHLPRSYTTGGGLGGSSLNEFLQGGSGEDYLSGAGGSDVMIGGGGADIFVWTLADIPAATVPTVDKVLDFGTSDRLDLRDLLSDTSLSPSIVIDNAGTGARVTVSYTEASTLHTQDIFVTFDAGGEQTLINDSGIVRVG